MIFIVNVPDGEAGPGIVAMDNVSIHVECDVNTGVLESYGLDAISVYPNPATDRILVDIPDEIPNYKISVFNTIGQRLYSKRNLNIIDVSSLREGVYFVEITDKISGLKVVKQVLIQ